MKKTLFGVLALVLVLATVLTGTALMSAATVEQNANVGDVKTVDAQHPIVVDGKMDEAYTGQPRLEIDFRDTSTTVEGLHSRGTAYFAWSQSENALYCYVIMNDVDVKAPGNQPWLSDSVELFIHRGNNADKDFDCDAVTDFTLVRGRQYRIDGYTNAPSCYLEQNGENVTYTWDAEKGRLAHPQGHMITDDTNQFGWYEGGWGAQVFDATPKGYAVEYKIDFPADQPLEAGEIIRFDFQVNDRYGASSPKQANVYYRSAAREAAGTNSGGSTVDKYDYFVLSSSVAKNEYTLENSAIGPYGREDASYERTTTIITERTETQKVTFTRIRTGTMAQNAGSSGAPSGGENNTTTTAAPSSGGGCGSSIAIGSSVAMIAVVGTAGFFAFRKRDEE